jgi:hypothetical protein
VWSLGDGQSQTLIFELQTFLRESTWGYPIISAIHVLGIAWFGGTVLIAQFAGDLRRLRQAGITLVLISGAVIFWLHPLRYSGSISFGVKSLLLVFLIWTKPFSRLALALWVAVIFASRGIAFF